MSQDSVQTGVDSLIAFLKEKKKVSITDVAKHLGISESSVKQWVDFLVEEKIVGLEYKFTKPYIYLNNESGTKKSKIIEEKRIEISTFKTDFVARARKSNIPPGQAEQLWKNHLINQLSIEKQFFFQESRKRQLTNIEDLWNEYRQQVLEAQEGKKDGTR